MGIEHNETPPPAIEVKANEPESAPDYAEQSGEDALKNLEKLFQDSPEKRDEKIDTALSKMTKEQLHKLADSDNENNPAVKRAREIIKGMDS